jgi:predicted glycosyltransferase
VRVLCYAQHLTGVGHFVRMAAIARGLADGHDVLLVDGGRPVPRAEEGPPRLVLPALHRGADGLAAVDGSLADTLVERGRRLARGIAEFRPDVVLIDHYPFSKWELEEEILALVAAARRVEPRVLVLCSLRDIAPKTPHERPDRGRSYEAEVAARLAATFDGVLVHADPAFTRFEEHFGSADAVPVPIHYTGFVATEQAEGVDAAPGPAYAVLSCGGGARGLPFLLATMRAFDRAAAAGIVGALRLRVHPGLFATSEEEATLRAAATPAIELVRFTPAFGRVLGASALSISRSGYNTTVEILQARVPSVVVPDPRMSDQPPRARRLAARGLATVVEGDPPDADSLVAAFGEALARPRVEHDLDLAGVAGTRAIVERLSAERRR